MTRKSIFEEVVCFLLAMNFFFGAMYKIAHFAQYATWLHYAPYIRVLPSAMPYLFIAGEFGICSLLLLAKNRTYGLYFTVIASIGYMLYVLAFHTFTHYLVFPFYAFQNNQSWLPKMIFYVILSWLAFSVLLIEHQKSLRNPHTKLV